MNLSEQPYLNEPVRRPEEVTFDKDKNPDKIVADLSRKSRDDAYRAMHKMIERSKNGAGVYAETGNDVRDSVDPEFALLSFEEQTRLFEQALRKETEQEVSETLVQADTADRILSLDPKKLEHGRSVIRNYRNNLEVAERTAQAIDENVKVLYQRYGATEHNSESAKILSLELAEELLKLDAANEAVKKNQDLVHIAEQEFEDMFGVPAGSTSK